MMTEPPQHLTIIGKEIAVLWRDGREDFLAMEFLRSHSPSAENVGERDILGRLHGGRAEFDFHGVTVTGWQFVGNYAVRFEFSDGHRTGIYSYVFLRELGRFPD